MPVYEFECPRGHTISDLVPIGTKSIPCSACLAERLASNKRRPVELATRVLSATPTTFRFADQRR